MSGRADEEGVSITYAFDFLRQTRCSLVFGRNSDHRCNGCGSALEGRRTVWCSGDCSKRFFENHNFGDARREARERATVWRLPDGDHRAAAIGFACSDCGEVGWHIEIDHIEPAAGRHAEYSCVHHQENLRALCRPCHRRRTATQAAERARERRLAREDASGQARLWTREAVG